MTTHNSSRLTAGNSPRSPEKINQDYSDRQQEVCSCCRFDTSHSIGRVLRTSEEAKGHVPSLLRLLIIIALYHLSLTADYVILRYRCFCAYVCDVSGGCLVVTATMHLKDMPHYSIRFFFFFFFFSFRTSLKIRLDSMMLDGTRSEGGAVELISRHTS